MIPTIPIWVEIRSLPPELQAIALARLEARRPDPPPRARDKGRLWCGHPATEAVVDRSMCRHRGDEHTQTCVSVCRTCANGGS